MSADAELEKGLQGLINSEMQVVTGAQPLLATPGALSSAMQRKQALRQLAARSIRTDAPDVYTVVKGDTLWDISGRFLSSPWLWPEVWQGNPEIENPHLIYPGDRIALTYVDGAPRLQVIGASSMPRHNNTASGPNRVPIASVPPGLIEKFIAKPLVVTKQQMANAGYVAATEEGHLMAIAGDHIYTRGDINGSRFTVFRPGKALVDPDTAQILGHETIHVSNASLIETGDPSKLVITKSDRETLVGDRLMPANAADFTSFAPRAAGTDKEGKIISLVGAIARAGKYQVAVLNLGLEDGVQQGDTFSVMRNDRVVRDNVRSGDEYFTIKGDKAAEVMVFRTFDKVSYALIMNSAREVRKFDRVQSTAAAL